MVAVLGACSVDLGKLRSPSHKDAAGLTDLSPDLVSANRDAATLLADGGETGTPPTGPDAQRGGVFDSGPTVADGGGTDGGAGTGDTADPGDGSVGMDPGDTASQVIDSVTDTGSTVDGDEALDAPEASDGGTGADNAYGTDAADGGLAGDARDAAFSIDARGKKLCPTTITGSLDPSDTTQIGRLSRIAPISTCGMTKNFPGNGADITNLHLYDIYHFINATGAPVCFNFTLTFARSQELYAAAYSAFNPINIVTSYLGDVGSATASPQTMGISVNAGATVDVVVYAIAMGTATAGSYTLSCSTE
jgi:hypothetical protein